MDAVLIAAQSGRALVEAAGRAGLRAYVADLFGDADTLELAAGHRALPGRFGGGRLGGAAILGALDALAAEAGRRGDRVLGTVLGSGFEAAPDLVARIGLARPLLGAAPGTVAALKDPAAFAALCARLGVPHPEIAPGPVPDPGAWLLKAAGGSGGGHVRRIGAGARRSAPAGSYLQRRVPGRAYALNVLAHAGGVAVLALTEQWCAPTRLRPYRWGGALARAAGEPGPLPAALVARVAEAAEGIAAATGLRGLASLDILSDGAAWWLLEVNPRPGATLDVLDRRGAPLLAAHIAACRGGRPCIGAAPRDAGAAEICYAARDHVAVAPIAWPSHVRDRPRAGTRVRRGAPLCTILATGVDGAAARDELTARMGRLNARLDAASARAPAQEEADS